ncbi:MAG TPA: SpoIIE family protein phosphatase [Pseudomonadales bacterium]|nr:SpoIIE family protein phosphatase [Pseudomonadales bacterium]
MNASPSLVHVLEITRKLAGHFELKDMVFEVLDAAKAVLQADSGSVWLLDETTGRLDMYLPEMTPRVSVGAGEGIVGECLTNRAIINVPDCYADPRFNKRVDRDTGYVTRTLLSVPLMGTGDKKVVGVMQLLNHVDGPFTAEDEALATALAAQSAIALQRARMMDALLEQERIREELSLAREMQMSTLPASMPGIPGYDFAGGFSPAEQVGGDMFDIASIGDKVFILLGDATGHDFSAALSATQMHAMLKAALGAGAALGDALRVVNNQLAESLPDNRFLTAFVGFLDPATNAISYHAPGQGPIMVYRAADDSFEWLPPSSFPVGILPQEEMDPAQVISLGTGDIVGVISDGLFECEDPQGEAFGEARTESTVRQHHRGTMEALRLALMTRVVAHSGGHPQADDITVVLVRRDQ